MGRLDLQRLPRRYHGRKNARLYRRGYTTLPHAVWGDSFAPPVITPTGVTVGSPGSFTPAGATPPANLTVLQGMGALGQTAGWTTGQYVVLGDASNANWTGVTWAAGIHALGAQTYATDPGSGTVGDVEAWVEANPDQADEVLAAEQARPAPRVTLVNWLQNFISTEN